MKNDKTLDDLVARIIKDPAAYDQLRGQLKTANTGHLQELLRLIDAANPPTLGTGGTS